MHAFSLFTRERARKCNIGGTCPPPFSRARFIVAPYSLSLSRHSAVSSTPSFTPSLPCLLLTAFSLGVCIGQWFNTVTLCWLQAASEILNANEINTFVTLYSDINTAVVPAVMAESLQTSMDSQGKRLYMCMKWRMSIIGRTEVSSASSSHSLSSLLPIAFSLCIYIGHVSFLSLFVPFCFSQLEFELKVRILLKDEEVLDGWWDPYPLERHAHVTMPVD